jgi:transcriptional regulator with XRE-family HTH domain
VGRRRTTDTDQRLLAFASQLRRARSDAGLSQDALAERAGVTQATVSLVERGLQDPGLTLVLDLASALEIGPSELTGSLQ